MNTINQNNQDKIYFKIVLAVTLVVFIAVIVLNQKVLPRPEIIPSFTYFLPKLNAFINAICSILLLVSLYFIKHKEIAKHKTINIITFLLSSVFLVSYIMYHYLANETKFPLDNPLRPLYFFILITHIVLAAAVLPMILLSFYYGLQMNVSKHKKLTRFTFPIWLYVTVTGVVVYLMISPFYPV
jgi:putative membrane protein